MMKARMNETQREIMEWGLIHDALPQAARICYQLWANGGSFAANVPIERVYRSDEERGPIVIWSQGRPADKIDVALPAGSITYSFNHPKRNGVHYYETCSYVWKSHEWVPGPKGHLFMSVGGIFSKPKVLDEKDGFARWVKGMRGPVQIGQ